MNFSSYFFGNLGNGYCQYIDDNTRPFLESIYNQCHSESQVIIKRIDRELLCYAYIIKLGTLGRYLGFCIILNGSAIINTHKLIFAFEQVVQTLYSENILSFNKTYRSLNFSMDNVMSITSLYPFISNVIKTIFSKSFSDKELVPLQPFDYGGASAEYSYYDINISPNYYVNQIGVTPLIISKEDIQTIIDISNFNINCKTSRIGSSKTSSSVKRSIGVTDSTRISTIYFLISIGVILVCFLCYVYKDRLANVKSKDITNPKYQTEDLIGNSSDTDNARGTLLASHTFYCMGNMGNYPICLDLQFDSYGRVAGTYKNVKYGTVIKLSGNYSGNNVTLKSSDGYESLSLELNYDEAGSLFTGKYKGRQSQPVHLNAYEYRYKGVIGNNPVTLLFNIKDNKISGVDYYRNGKNGTLVLNGYIQNKIIKFEEFNGQRRTGVFEGFMVDDDIRKNGNELYGTFLNYANKSFSFKVFNE